MREPREGTRVDAMTLTTQHSSLVRMSRGIRSPEWVRDVTRPMGQVSHFR